MLEAAQRYAEHLSDADLAMLAEVADLADVLAGRAPAHLRAHPELIERALSSPGAFSRLFAPGTEPLARVSPFVVFAVAVHRAIAELEHSRFVEERAGASWRVPVFDVGSLRDFAADPARRLLLVELLASYTRVASGPVWVRRGTRWHRQRFSELDAARLASLATAVPAVERAGIYRRLGDLSLFLTGVFPDHATRRPVGPVELERLLRSVRDLGPADPEDLGRIGTSTAVVLAWLGPKWYRLAARHAPLPQTARALDDMAGRFEPARRLLNLVTDRFLFPIRGRIFPDVGG